MHTWQPARCASANYLLVVHIHRYRIHALLEQANDVYHIHEAVL